jgi:transcriptional regulator with XRE-family HTH domain
MDDAMTLKQVRELAGIGLRELARDAGVGKDVVWRMENGRTTHETVGYGDVKRILRALRRAGLTRRIASDDEIFPIA